MKTNTIHSTLIIAVLLMGGIIFLNPEISRACDTKITIHDGGKENYSVEDEVIVKIRIFLSHKNCPLGIDGTQYKVEGLQVIGATQWKKVSAGLFERFVKIKVLQTAKGVSTLHVLRTCDKEGGYGKINLEVT